MKEKTPQIGTKIEILTDGAGVSAVWKKGDVVYIRKITPVSYGTSEFNKGKETSGAWISTFPRKNWKVLKERHEIIEDVLSQIKADIAHFDWQALEELLALVPDSELERYLSLYRDRQEATPPKATSPVMPRTIILRDIESILEHGTSFASFDYHDRRRNVLIGTEAANGYSRWGTFKNRAIVEHNGKSYLVALEMSTGEIKNFDLEKISGWKWK